MLDLPPAGFDLRSANANELTQRLRKLGWIEPTAAITEVTTAGDGNMNVVRRVRYQLGNAARSGTHSGTLIVKQSVPFVAKYPEIPAPVARIEVEAGFYRAISEHDVLTQRTPRVLGFAPELHLLALADAGENSDYTRWYDHPDPASQASQTLADLIGWLRALHAVPIDPDQFRNLDMRTLNHAHIFEIPFAPDNGITLPQPLLDRARQLREDKSLMARIEHLGTMYLGRQPGSQPPVLLHGDFYPGSWIRCDHMGAMVLDPEFAFAGPAEFDLGVLTAHLVMCGFDNHFIDTRLDGYAGPYDENLAMAFAGVEIMRRLLGVAQLPLSADSDTRIAWLDIAGAAVLALPAP